MRHKLTITPFQKALNEFEHLMKNWEMVYFNDGSTEECSYTKDKVQLIFEEDLREHIVNFKIIHPSKRYINVYYRKCSVFSNGLKTDELIASLNKIIGLNNIESEEITMYFDFLKLNDFLV